ncbi:MAG TPA: putative toxin-antitoxin system toxin component, PIN family [Chloroflexota bacterium]|nr:putative toxin-antitoxin system toxin component, PIN family [Chloroflexota bacterium]
MIVAVLDTNTIVSETIAPQGIPSQILQAGRAHQFRWITSIVIIDEVTRALSRPRLQRKYRVGPADVDRVRELLEQHPIVSPITVQVQGIATHPEDDLILATAASVQAEYLVTGDQQLQRLGSYQGVQIVSPRQFLDVLSPP